MLVWKAISSMVLMIFDTFADDSWMPCIEVTISDSMWFDVETC